MQDDERERALGRTIGSTRPAARALIRMPPRTEALIRGKLRLLAERPDALANNIKALRGTQGYHLRIGDWRVIFTIAPVESWCPTSARAARSTAKKIGMTIVRTKTPSGEAIVILPEADFQRLVALAEDATGARTLQASQARLASGADEIPSKSDLDAVRRAPRPLPFWRKRPDMTMAALASLGGITESLLSAMERGERTADLIVYRTLARAGRRPGGSDPGRYRPVGRFHAVTPSRAASSPGRA